MSDLITAAQKQVEYARNELKSGDKAAALEHLNKAAAFLERAASTGTAEVGVLMSAANEPLSQDAGTALAQILAATGHPLTFDADGATIAIDPAGVAQDASEEQNRELALLGFFGVGPSRTGDQSLRDTYYSNEGTKPIDPDVNPWQDYLRGRG